MPPGRGSSRVRVWEKMKAQEELERGLGRRAEEWIGAEGGEVAFSPPSLTPFELEGRSSDLSSDVDTASDSELS